MQEAHALQAKKRQMAATVAASQKEQRALAGQQERLEALAADLASAQGEAAAAREQLVLAQSRGDVLEKAYAAAVEVRTWGSCLCIVGSTCLRHEAAGVPPQSPRRASIAAAEPVCGCCPPPLLQESHKLQAQQRQLQTALAASRKEARALAGLEERLQAQAAELAASQQAVVAAQEQLELAVSRSGVMEKAYAAAVEESQVLQTKQRQMAAELAGAQKQARAVAGLQERLEGLAGELDVARAAAAAAGEQLGHAESRISVLEKAHAAAVQV